MRTFGTKQSGFSFDWDMRVAVWVKGKVVPGRDPAVWRYDACNALIRFDDYGDTNSNHGWEIDHIQPTSRGGSDSLSNLQPLQWENNRGKGDSYPNWTCTVRYRAA